MYLLKQVPGANQEAQNKADHVMGRKTIVYNIFFFFSFTAREVNMVRYILDRRWDEHAHPRTTKEKNKQLQNPKHHSVNSPK